MTSKTGFFNPTIARSAFKRTMPLWAVHAVIWIFAMPVLLGNLSSYYGENPERLGYYILMTMFIGGTLMAFGFCCALSEILCNYLYSSKSIGFYHSLPVKRSCIFSTHLIVQLGVLLVPAALIGAFSAIMLTPTMGGDAWYYIGKWLLCYVFFCVFFTGFSLLCCHLTGHVAFGTVFYLILNFAAVILEGLIRTLSSFFIYGMTFRSDFVLDALSPIIHNYMRFNVNMGQGSYYAFSGNTYYVILAAAGCVMTALAFMLYQSRKSESSGEVVSSAPLRPVFKYCMTAGFGVIVGFVFYALSYQLYNDGHSLLWLGICMTAASAIGYFGSEMLLKKSLKVLKYWRGFLLPVALIVFFMVSISFDLFGMESYVPSPDKADSVYLSVYGANIKVPSDSPIYDKITALHSVIVENKKANLSYYDESSRAWHDCDMLYAYFTYNLKNGNELRRQYDLPVSLEPYDIMGYDKAMSEIFTDPEALDIMYAGIFSEEASLSMAYVYPWNYDECLTIDSPHYKELLTALRTDLLSGSISTYGHTTETEDTYYLEIAVPDPYDDLDSASLPSARDVIYYQFPITPQAEKTYAIITNSANYVPVEG